LLPKKKTKNEKKKNSTPAIQMAVMKTKSKKKMSNMHGLSGFDTCHGGAYSRRFKWRE